MPEDKLMRVEELVDRINITCFWCNRDWANILKGLKGEEKAEEENVF